MNKNFLRSLLKYMASIVLCGVLLGISASEVQSQYFTYNKYIEIKFSVIFQKSPPEFEASPLLDKIFDEEIFEEEIEAVKEVEEVKEIKEEVKKVK